MDYNSKKKLNEKISQIDNKKILRQIFEIAKKDLIIDNKKIFK